MNTVCEKKEPAAVAWLKGTKHRFYEEWWMPRPLNDAIVGDRRMNPVVP
ncbi:MAG: hypothetical protein ABIF87_08155 [Pseudomonadota bacterium]